MTEQASEQVLQLDPAKVLADDNSRWGDRPKQTTVDGLMESILEQGGVLQNVEVSELPKGHPGRKDGYTHRLNFGFNRHEAVSRLNKEQNAGLSLPAVVRELADGADRVRRQITENHERETMSPMDKAVAIKRLLDASVPKPEIRRIFRASGGRKGTTVQPMSNAMLNILLNLLDLPKTIQEKIHTGLVGVEGAYMLGKVSPDKRAAVLERAEADRLKQIDAEEKDEDRFLAAETRVSDAEAKVEAVAQTEAKAREDVTEAEAIVKARTVALKDIKNGILAMEEPAGPAEVEKVKAAEADLKAAKKIEKDAKNALAKVLGDKTKASEAVETVKAKLEASRKAAKKPKKPIGKTAVKVAAKALGVKATGNVPLGIADIRQTVKDLSAGKYGADDRTAAVALAFKDCFDGRDTDKQTAERLNRLLDAMGAKLPPKPAKATPPAAPDVQQGPKGKK